MSRRIEAEGAVIGCCLADPDAYWLVADMLVPQDFSDGAHAALYAEIGHRARRGDLFDAVTIGVDLPDLRDTAMDTQEAHGWRVGNVKAYAGVVAAEGLARRVRQAGATIARLEGDDVVGQAQRILSACAPRNVEAVRHIRYYLAQSMEDVNRRREMTERITGVPTGIPALDDLTEGWQPSDLIIVAARPSVGKTAFAMQCVLYAAKAAKSCLVFSLEMNGKQIGDRGISAEGRIDGKKLRSPKAMAEEDWAAWARGLEVLHGLPIYIDESSGTTVDVICARARQQHAQTPLGLVMIDYLTMIAPPKASSTSDALQLVTRALKGLAKELNVPVILLSQLNRGGDGQRPTQRSLRDSGAIEQDADVIIFLHRPNDNHRGYLELLLDKQRNGPTGELAIEADMKYMRFEQASRRPEGAATTAKTTADAEWDALADQAAS